MLALASVRGWALAVWRGTCAIAACAALAACGGGEPDESEAPPAFVQGRLTASQASTDLAIVGYGAFQFDDGYGLRTYSRKGNLSVDKDGYLVNQAQRRLLGWAAASDSANGSLVLQALRLVDAVDSPARATRRLFLKLSLGASSQVDRTPFDVNDPETFQFITAFGTYDAEGNFVDLLVYFSQPEPNVWHVHMTADKVPVRRYATSVSTAQLLPSSTALARFELDGNMNAVCDCVFSAIRVQIPPRASATMATAESISVMLQVSKAEPRQLTEVHQDGRGKGHFLGVSLDPSGGYDAYYSNGSVDRGWLEIRGDGRVTRRVFSNDGTVAEAASNPPDERQEVLGRIVLAAFHDTRSLVALPGAEWAAAPGQTPAVVGAPGTQRMGGLVTLALEPESLASALAIPAGR